MRVFVVSDSADDNTWIVAVYSTRELADEHERVMGGYVEECEVSEALHPDATDPAKQAARDAESQREKERWERYRQEQEAAAKSRAEVRPSPPHMSLCSCWTFSKLDGYFINTHGYCSYCGGFTPEVFRRHMGEAELHRHIDKLSEYKRLKMRELVSSR